MRSVRMRRSWSAGYFLVATAAITTTLVVVACAKGTDAGVEDEGGAVEAGARDVFVIPTDAGNPDDDTGVNVKPGIDSSPGNCTMKVVINELRTDGATANDEFVELYNPSECAVPLTGWAIKYEAASGSTGPAGYTFASGDSIASKGYFLVASASFVGTKDATLMTGFAAASGQVGLLDDKAKIVDGVAYGTVTGGTYGEKSAAPSPVSGKSIGRMPNGTDTDSNSADFKALTTSSPGAAN